ncbi:MAG TPA: aminotransferase class III-fold pyridoxal phosphate-dependent enzyme, partial [Solirubrobacteraceae bacterium]
MLTLGKGLGGGVPLAALVASARASCFEPGDQGGTFNGNPLMAAVGCAVVDFVRREEFLASVRETGAYLEERLAALSAETGHGAVRGRGVLQALALTHGDAGKIAEGALDRGLLINAPRPDTLRFMPALTVSRGEVDEMIDRLAPCLACGRRRHGFLAVSRHAPSDSREDTVTKILTPPQQAPVMEIARELLPPGMELVVADPTKPDFYDAAAEAEYFLGSPRFGIGNEFFRAAPKLKLVQLTSAGYDRVDIEAARKAKVPVSNNGGAN